MKNLSKIIYYLEAQPGEEWGYRTNFAIFDNEEDAEAAFELVLSDPETFFAATGYEDHYLPTDGGLYPLSETEEPMWIWLEKSWPWNDSPSIAGYLYLTRDDAEVIIDKVLSGEPHEEHGNVLSLGEDELLITGRGRSIPFLLALVASERGYPIRKAPAERNPSLKRKLMR